MLKRAILVVIVCVYDQNFAIVIEIQRKKRNVQSDSTVRRSFNSSFNYTEPFLFGSEHSWRTISLDKC